MILASALPGDGRMGKNSMEYEQLRLLCRSMYCVMIFALLVASATGQTAKAAADVDNIGVRHGHTAWRSPESVMRDLSSPEDVVRGNALSLFGLDENQINELIFDQNSHSTTPKAIGKRVITLDVVELRYAALGEDATQHAILSVQSGPMAYAAVAIPKGKGWERIAFFSCWCKYETNPVAEAVSLARTGLWSGPEPRRFELVLRTSGGGTGVYEQDEGHYRVHQNELRQVLSFVSRYSNGCAKGPSMWCRHLEKRWFYARAVEHSFGAVVVEAVADFDTKNTPPIEYDVRELENRHFKNIACSTYIWDETSFRYRPFKFENPCLAPKPIP